MAAAGLPLELFISTDGCDLNNGTLSSPFRTFDKVLDCIKNSNSGIPINVRVRGGKYYFSKPLTFSSETIGNRKSEINFINYDNEEVIISGAIRLNAEWRPYNGNIVVADIGNGYSFDTLFVNGEPQVLARYPNYEKDSILNGYASDAISSERVSRWSNPAGGFIRALHDREWGGNSYIITGKTPDNELEYVWVGDNNRGSGMHETKRMVENIFEELDAPREWFYNQSTGQLFFYPAAGLNLNTALIECAVADELIRFTGSSVSQTINNVSFEGFTFTQTHRTLFTRRYERPLRGDWGMVRAGALFFENAANISVKNCRFALLGGNAVMMSGYNENHMVDNNDFIDIGASPVLIMGKQSAARDPSTWDGNNHKTVISDFEPGPRNEDYPRKITISNNYMTNIGIYEKQSAGVCISISEFIKVSRNTIHHAPRAGININDGNFGGHIIEHNDIFDCVRETGDHGPFNSWGRDRFWSVPVFDTRGKFGREKKPYALLDARSPTIIRNNRIHGTHAFGFDLDDGSTNYKLYNNLCLGVGIKLREGFYRKAYNNILVGAHFQIHVSYALNGDIVTGNIVYNSKAYGPVGINEGSDTIYKNNIYWNNGNEVEGIREEDEGSIVADPLFRAPEENDYSVLAGSPALELGFVNFPMKDEDFGRADKPKPPEFKYVSLTKTTNTKKFEGCVISDIGGDGLRSAAGLPDYSGVYIAEMGIRGSFQSQGFRIGDVIRSINGVKIENVDDLIERIGQIAPGASVKVEIYRNQKPMELMYRLA